MTRVRSSPRSSASPRKHDLPDKLILPGRVPHEQVEAHYSLIDIAPFPRKPQPVTEWSRR